MDQESSDVAETSLAFPSSWFITTDKDIILCTLFFLYLSGEIFMGNTRKKDGNKKKMIDNKERQLQLSKC